MASTFTGLKLKGELGRFGKTEICNVLGVYPMPDEKVLSGCEWGNILVWEAGLVKLEVTQRNRKPCHGGPIVQFMRSPDGSEITTVGMDGRICIWFWDTVEQADPPEDDPFVELNPVFDTQIPNAQIMSLLHKENNKWFAQDGNGAIWSVDLETESGSGDATHCRQFICHAGPIAGLVALRSVPLLVSFGTDGALFVYRTDWSLLIYRTLFPAGGSTLLYPHHEADPTDTTLLLGFLDGTVRLCGLNFLRLMQMQALQSSTKDGAQDSINALPFVDHDGGVFPIDSPIIFIYDIFRPHTEKVSCITMEPGPESSLVVTGGANSTIFLYRKSLQTQTAVHRPFTLTPLGYIETPNVVTFFHWKIDKPRTLLIGGSDGILLEVVLPDIPKIDYNKITTFKTEFDSYKETCMKKLMVRYKPLLEMEDEISLNLDADGARKAESEDEAHEEEPDIELSPVEDFMAGRLLWAFYDQLSLGATGGNGGTDAVWIVQEGCGCLLRLIPGTTDILKYAPVPDAWNEDITSYKLICDNSYIILGLGNGEIRILRLPSPGEDSSSHRLQKQMKALLKLQKKLGPRLPKTHEAPPIAMTEFLDHFRLPMHDRYTGAIRHIEFSPNSNLMFSAGDDGNIFSYKVNFYKPLLPPAGESSQVTKFPKVNKQFYEEIMELESHEQKKQREMNEAALAAAGEHKRKVLGHLAHLATDFREMVKSNRQLPISQQIDVELDPRPIAELHQDLAEKMALTHRKLAHQLEVSDLRMSKMMQRNIEPLDMYPFAVYSVNDPLLYVRVIRQRKLSKEFWDQLDEVHKKMAEAALRGRRSDEIIRKAAAKRATWGGPRTASFLLGLPSDLPYPLFKALRWYYQRLNLHHLQFSEWQEHLSKKPDPKALPPGAAEALHQAELSIGYHRLKTESDYIAPPGHNTQLRLCHTRQEIYEIKHDFNQKVMMLRDDKIAMYDRAKVRTQRLAEIQSELPHGMAKDPEPLPDINDDVEFPEKYLEVQAVTLAPQGVSVTAAHPSRVTHATRRIEPASNLSQSVKYQSFIDYYDQRPDLAKSETVKFETAVALTRKPGEEETNTEFEVELRNRQIKMHLHEQDVLLEDAIADREHLDIKIKALSRERLRVQLKSQLLELHLLQLHREMIVLNKFEAHEDRLSEKVYNKLSELRSVKEKIDEHNTDIEDHRNNIDNLEIKVASCQAQFKRIIGDNKFADFLRKIFKKKYKPPKLTEDSDEESSSSSSSSSSSEADAGSLDSGDIGPIRLDPTICPLGCDPLIYQQTYAMRDQRHGFEQEIKEEEKAIDGLKKYIENAKKIGNKVERQLEKRQEALKNFMHEKQGCMNEIEVTVVLRSSQLRANALDGVGVGAALAPGFKSCGLDDVLVFPERLLQKLRHRVQELEIERAQQLQRHMIMKKHLHRMNVDIAHMNEEIERLRGDLGAAAKRKTGKTARADRTLDAQLRRMARRFKLQAGHILPPTLTDQLHYWRNRFAEQEKLYFKSLEELTEKLRLAAALELENAVPTPQEVAREERVRADATRFEKDAVRLRRLRSDQRLQISSLRAEIDRLRQKPSVPNAPFQPPPLVKPATPDSFDLIPEPPSPKAASPRVPFRFSNVKLKILSPALSAKISELVRESPEPIMAPSEPQDEFVIPSLDTSLLEIAASAIRACIERFGEKEDVTYDIIQRLVDAIPDIVQGSISRTDAVDIALRALNDDRRDEAEEAIHNLLDSLIDQQLSMLEGEDANSALVQAVEAVKIRPSKASVERIGSATSAGQSAESAASPIQVPSPTISAQSISQRVKLANTSMHTMLKTLLNQMPSHELESDEASDLIAATLMEEVPDIVDIAGNVNGAEIAQRLAGIGDTSPDKIVELVDRVIKTLLAQKPDPGEGEEIIALVEEEQLKDTDSQLFKTNIEKGPEKED